MRLMPVREYVSMMFPDGFSNDNPSLIMTGAIDQDTETLFNKWALSEEERKAWPGCIDQFHCAAHTASVGIAFAQRPRLVDAEAIWTAGAIGILKALFCWLRQLKRPEAIYVLEELARQTDKYLAETRRKENGVEDKSKAH